MAHMPTNTVESQFLNIPWKMNIRFEKSETSRNCGGGSGGGVKWQCLTKERETTLVSVIGRFEKSNLISQRKEKQFLLSCLKFWSTMTCGSSGHLAFCFVSTWFLKSHLHRFLPRFLYTRSSIKMGNMFLFQFYSWWCWFIPGQASNKQGYPALQPVEIKTKHSDVCLAPLLTLPILKD